MKNEKPEMIIVGLIFLLITLTIFKINFVLWGMNYFIEKPAEFLGVVVVGVLGFKAGYDKIVNKDKKKNR